MLATMILAFTIWATPAPMPVCINLEVGKLQYVMTIDGKEMKSGEVIYTFKKEVTIIIYTESLVNRGYDEFNIESNHSYTVEIKLPYVL